MLLAGLTTVLIAMQVPAPGVSTRSACERAGAAFATDGGTVELCAGEDALRRSASARADDSRRLWTQAEQHFRRAVNLSRQAEVRRWALERLADCYDDKHLDQPKAQEAALRELLALEPSELTYLTRLVRLLEVQGFWEGAETVLMDARRERPEAVDLYRQLAQFYARRVSAMTGPTTPEQVPASSGAGEPDMNGVYRVGGSLVPPSRLDVPQYPPDAAAAQIGGRVLAEVVIDAAGRVTEAKIVRGIPLLDDAALAAVRHWQFVPSVVNGTAVPVRMTVTVNFTPPPSAPRRQVPVTTTPPQR
jgi:TonB family protein